MTYNKLKWIKGKLLPPIVDTYTDINDYKLEVAKYIPIRIIESYSERNGY